MKFSIITICYNSSKTIERTISSVLAQTYTDFEYIIVDGASNDDTLNIINRYKDLFGNKLRVLSEPDNGIYDAMNKGIKMSVGDLVGIVNSDDWLEPDALANVYKTFVNNECNLYTNYCGSINYHWKSKCKCLGVDIRKFKNNTKFYIMAGVRHPAIFVPKNVYKQIGLFDAEMRLSADQDFILRCFYSGVQFVKVDHVLSNMTEGGISTEGSSKSRRYAIEDRKRMLSKFKKKGFSFIWLFYSWRVRGLIKKILISLRLYKVS